MHFLLACFCFFYTFFGVLAEDLCAATLDGFCGTEEGLELLQSRAEKVTPQEAKELARRKELESRPQAEREKIGKLHEAKQENKSGTPEESNVERVRFRARHKTWIDILDVYKDGFFKRKNGHDSGIWHVNGTDQLVLEWLGWREARLLSPDGGASFNATGQDPFTLKSYYQPAWWHQHFTGKNVALLQAQSEKQKSQIMSTKAKRAIIRAHMDGRKADLDQSGYQAVAYLKDNAEMEMYIRRVVDSLNMTIADVGGLKGIVPYYSGAQAWQSFRRIIEELKNTADASKGSRWVRNSDGRNPAVPLQARDNRHPPMVLQGHIDGKTAPLEEIGYKAVASLKNNTEMETYMRRVAESLHMQIANVGGLRGMVPYYSGVAASQSLHRMVIEFKDAAHASEGRRWLVLHPSLSLLQEQAEVSTVEDSAETAAQKEQQGSEEEGEETEEEEEEETEQTSDVQDSAEEKERDSEEDAEQDSEEAEEQDSEEEEEEAGEEDEEQDREKEDEQDSEDEEEQDSEEEEEQDSEEEEGPGSVEEGELQTAEGGGQEAAKAGHAEVADNQQANQSHKSLLQAAAKVEVDLEEPLLQQSDNEKIRFRARHKDWIDILDVYKDGFYRRYHTPDVGVWHMNQRNQLVLKWLRWGEVSLQSVDGGKSFNTTKEVPFTLKSHVQPSWWSERFNGTSASLLQDQASRSQETTTLDIKNIVKSHINGKEVALTEDGYRVLASIKDDAEMKTFMRRVAQSLNMKIVNEGGLNGMVPYYSGLKTWQSLEKMKRELKNTAHASEGALWVTDKNADSSNH